VFDDVLGAPGHVQIAVRIQVAQVARANKAVFPEKALGVLAAVVIAGGVGRALNHDLANLIRRDGDFVLHNFDTYVSEWPPNADDSALVDPHRGRWRPGADSNGRLGETIAGNHHVLQAENPLEIVDGFRPHGLGRVERHAQAGQIIGFGIAHIAQAEPVGEVRRGGQGGAALLNGVQPDPNVGQVRRKEKPLGGQVERRHGFENQAHVMINGQPAHEPVLRGDLHAFDELAQVDQQAAMREHDALGDPGAAGGVLDERHIIRADFRKSGDSTCARSFQDRSDSKACGGAGRGHCLRARNPGSGRFPFNNRQRNRFGVIEDEIVFSLKTGARRSERQSYY